MKALDLVKHGFEVKEETFKCVAICKVTGVVFECPKGALSAPMMFKIGKHIERIEGMKHAKK